MANSEQTVGKVLTVGDYPVTRGAEMVLAVRSLSTGIPFFFCPDCGCAWAEPPGDDLVSIDSPARFAPYGYAVASSDDLIAAFPSCDHWPVEDTNDSIDALSDFAGFAGFAEAPKPVASECQFWVVLMFMLSGELSRSQNRAVRSLWCDGLTRTDVIEVGPPTKLEGDAWIWNKGSSEDWAFTLILPIGLGHIDNNNWDALLPGPGDTGWVTADVQSKTLLLYARGAMPVTNP